MNVNKYGTFELQWHNYNISAALECANVDDMDYHKYHHH